MSREKEGKKMTREEEEEEKKRILEKVEMIKTRNPETIHYVEKKLSDKGISRMDRHPVDGLGGIGHPPPKSGRGGKFTWEGPGGPADGELDPAPPAIDPRDPNYIEEEEEEDVGEDKAAVLIGQVEVAKVAEAKEGVSRIEVQPPLQPSILTD